MVPGLAARQRGKQLGDLDNSDGTTGGLRCRERGTLACGPTACTSFLPWHGQHAGPGELEVPAYRPLAANAQQISSPAKVARPGGGALADVT